MRKQKCHHQDDKLTDNILGLLSPQKGVLRNLNSFAGYFFLQFSNLGEKEETWACEKVGRSDEEEREREELIQENSK